MDEKTSKDRSGWKSVGTHTRIYFILATVLIGFGLVGVLVNIFAPMSPTRESFYSASLYSNTAGIFLLLIANIRILKERERMRESERAARLGKGAETDD